MLSSRAQRIRRLTVCRHPRMRRMPYRGTERESHSAHPESRFAMISFHIPAFILLLRAASGLLKLAVSTSPRADSTALASCKERDAPFLTKPGLLSSVCGCCPCGCIINVSGATCKQCSTMMRRDPPTAEQHLSGGRCPHHRRDDHRVQRCCCQYHHRSNLSIQLKLLAERSTGALRLTGREKGVAATDEKLMVSFAPRLEYATEGGPCTSVHERCTVVDMHRSDVQFSSCHLFILTIKSASGRSHDDPI